MTEVLPPFKSENTQTLGELFMGFLEHYSTFEYVFLLNCPSPLPAFNIVSSFSNYSYSRYAISVRTAGVLPVEQCRLVRTIKNESHTWVNLCVEGKTHPLTSLFKAIFINTFRLLSFSFTFARTIRLYQHSPLLLDVAIFEQIKSVFVMSWNKLRDTMDLNQLFDRPFMANPPRILYNTNYNYVRSFPTSSSSSYYVS